MLEQRPDFVFRSFHFDAGLLTDGELACSQQVTEWCSAHTSDVVAP